MITPELTGELLGAVAVLLMLLAGTELKQLRWRTARCRVCHHSPCRCRLHL